MQPAFCLQAIFMIGILVQLAISWLLVWIIEKKDLSVLGLKPTRKRVVDFLSFFLLASACSASGFIFRMLFAREYWELNPQLDFSLIMTGLWWNIKAVLFEELIFRGVLLFILIKRVGATAAIIVSAIAFGIYHWFSFEVIGQPGAMAFVFFTTGVAGLLYAYAYAKTCSLYIPIALHLGWNFIRIFVFSEGSIGNGILVPVKPAPVVQVSWFIYFIVIWLPVLSWLLFSFILLRRKKSVKFKQEQVVG